MPLLRDLENVEVAPVPGIDAGLRRRLEAAEIRIDELQKEKAHLSNKLSESETSRKAAEVKTREAVETRNIQMESVENVNSEINSMQVQLAEARNRTEEAEARSEKLVRRVNELEHQVSVRATELAKALGETESSENLSNNRRNVAKRGWIECRINRCK